MGKLISVSHCNGNLISYWVITENGTVLSRTNVSRVTDIEVQTDENKARITALDKAIQEGFNDEDHLIVKGGKVQPKDWSEQPFYRDSNFQKEFSLVLSNDEVSEADKDFYPDIYDDTYLIVEL